MVRYDGGWASFCDNYWPFEEVGPSMLAFHCKSTRPCGQKMWISNMRDADAPHQVSHPSGQASPPLCQCGPHSGQSTPWCFSRCNRCLAEIVVKTKRLRRFAIIVLDFGVLSSNKGRNTGPVYRLAAHLTHYYDVTEGLMGVTGKQLLFEAGDGKMEQLEGAKELLKAVEDSWVSGTSLLLAAKLD